ncbi:hypothetical protein DFAR_2770032 [Desulfarculales bacterium]
MIVAAAQPSIVGMPVANAQGTVVAYATDQH